MRRRSPPSVRSDDPAIATAGRRLPAGRGDLSVRLGRRLVLGSRRHLRPPRADVRRALRRLVPRRARRAAVQASAERRRAAPACSVRTPRSRRWTGPGGPRCGSRSARCAIAIDARPAPSRVLAGLERMHVEGEAGTDVLAALACNDLTLPELLHGRPSFQLLTTIAERVAPDAPFLDLFWHYRAIFAPVLAPAGGAHGAGALLSRRLDRLCGAARGAVEPPHRPAADGDRARHLRARARHGARARRLDPRRGGRRVGAAFDLGAADLAAAAAVVVVLPGAVAHRLRSGASHHHAVGRQPRASRSPTARRPRRSRSCPTASPCTASVARRRRRRRRDRERPGRAARAAPARRVRRAAWCRSRISSPSCARATSRSRSSTLEARVIGPSDEDPGYAARCRQLVARLGRTQQHPVRRADAARPRSTATSTSWC